MAKNVIVFGMVGAGKASVANAMFGVDSETGGFEVGGTFPTGIEDIRSKSFSTTVAKGKVTLFDILRSTANAVSSTLKTRLDDFIASYSNKPVPLILFVIKENVISEVHSTAFDQLVLELNKVPALSSLNTAIVVTGCENMNDDARQRVINELQNNDSMKNVVAFAGRGIYAVGLPKLEETLHGAKTALTEQRKRDEETLQSLLLQQTAIETEETLSDSQETASPLSKPPFSRVAFPLINSLGTVFPLTKRSNSQGTAPPPTKRFNFQGAAPLPTKRSNSQEIAPPLSKRLALWRPFSHRGMWNNLYLKVACICFPCLTLAFFFAIVCLI